MTYGDKIRAMSDEELADFLAELLLHHRTEVIKKLQACGIATNVNVVAIPTLAKAELLQMLREPVMEEQL